MKEIILIVEHDDDDIKNFQDHIQELNAGYEVVPEKSLIEQLIE